MRYLVLYVVLAILLITLPITGLLGYAISYVIVAPLLIAVILSLVGGIVRLKSIGFRNLGPGLISYLIGRFINSLVLTYIILNNAALILIKYYPHSTQLIMNSMGFLALTIMGALTWTLRHPILNDLGHDYNAFAGTQYFLGLVSASFMLYGLSLLMSMIYGPLSYPFTISAITALILSILSLVGIFTGSSGFEAINNVLRNSRAIVAGFFGIGLLYSILRIPKPSLWNLYILAVFVIIASLIVVYVGYRAYVSSTAFIERMEEEIYEAHRHRISLVNAPELKPLVNAVEDFVKHGKKELLLTYLTFMLSNNGYEFDKIQDILSPLINYSSLKEQGVRMRRSTVEAEINDRINLVNELMRRVLSANGNTKAQKTK